MAVATLATDAPGDLRWVRSHLLSQLDALAPRPGIDRQVIAQHLLIGAACALLPSKPADVWVALLSGRAAEWIEDPQVGHSSPDSHV